MDESIQTVREQLKDFYEKQILLPNYQARKTYRNELKMLARDFLDRANPSERFDSVITRILLDQSSTIPNWRAVSCVMLCMEQYAINLLNCPWKKEFHKILTYSGFYKTELKSCLQDSALEKLFSIIRYRRSADSFVLKSMPQRSFLLHVALNFYLTAIECENYNKLFAAFESRGLSTVGAMQFRLAHHGSVKTCCDIINRRYSTSMQEQREELKGRSAVRSCSVDIDTSVSTCEWKDARGTNNSTAVENNSLWECTGTLDEHAEISRELVSELKPRFKSPRERRRESREVAEDIEEIRLVQRPVISVFSDSSVYESFSNTKTKKLAGQYYDTSANEDDTDSEISKEQHPKLSFLAGIDQGQTIYHRKLIDRISALNREELADADKERHRFVSVQDCNTNSELALDEKTNKQLSINEGSQTISEKHEGRRRQKQSAAQKRVVGSVQLCDSDPGNRQSVNVGQSEMQRDSEKHNRKQQCSKGMVQWQCEACTLVNKPSESVCRACNRSRNCADEKPLKSGGRQCNQCTFVNSCAAQKCEVCSSDLIGSSTYV